jgi:hypothetical protein
MLVQLGTFRLHSSNSLDERGLSACLCCLLSCSAGSCVTKVFGLETPPKEPAVKMSKRSFTKLEKQSMVSLRCSCFISLLFLQWSSRLHTYGQWTKVVQVCVHLVCKRQAHCTVDVCDNPLVCVSCVYLDVCVCDVDSWSLLEALSC